MSECWMCGGIDFGCPFCSGPQPESCIRSPGESYGAKQTAAPSHHGTDVSMGQSNRRQSSCFWDQKQTQKHGAAQEYTTFGDFASSTRRGLSYGLADLEEAAYTRLDLDTSAASGMTSCPFSPAPGAVVPPSPFGLAPGATMPANPFTAIDATVTSRAAVGAAAVEGWSPSAKTEPSTRQAVRPSLPRTPGCEPNLGNEALLQPGAQVVLQGLRKLPHLNGLRGVCEYRDPTCGRWVIQLETGETKAFKEKNLLVLDPLCQSDPTTRPLSFSGAPEKSRPSFAENLVKHATVGRSPDDAADKCNISNTQHSHEQQRQQQQQQQQQQQTELPEASCTVCVENPSESLKMQGHLLPTAQHKVTKKLGFSFAKKSKPKSCIDDEQMSKMQASEVTAEMGEVTKGQSMARPKGRGLTKLDEHMARLDALSEVETVHLQQWQKEEKEVAVAYASVPKIDDILARLDLEDESAQDKCRTPVGHMHQAEQPANSAASSSSAVPDMGRLLASLDEEEAQQNENLPSLDVVLAGVDADTEADNVRDIFFKMANPDVVSEDHPQDPLAKMIRLTSGIDPRDLLVPERGKTPEDEHLEELPPPPAIMSRPGRWRQERPSEHRYQAVRTTQQGLLDEMPFYVPSE